MGIDVQTSLEIDRPRALVAAYATDPDLVRTWYAAIDAVRWRTPPPLEVGTELDFEARFLGRRLVYTYRVLEHVPAERFVMSTAQGPFPMETTYTWADTATGGTLMRLRNRGEPRGFAGVATFVMSRAVRRANTQDLARLAQVLPTR